MSTPAGSTPAAPASRSVLHLAWPVILSFVMRQLFVFVDSIFAARIGDHAVAAIGLSFPFEFLLVAAWVGASTGMTSLLSRAMGAREGERIEQVVRTSRHVIAAIVPFFLLLGAAIWFLSPRLVQRPGGGGVIPPEVLEPFRIYATVIVAGTALTGFWSIIPDSIVKAHHDMKATMWAGIWSNLVNVGLNCLFVLGLGWGMFGVAFSTVLGRLAALVYALAKARGHETRRKAEGLDTVPGTYPRPLRALLVLAVPAGITYLLMATESSIVNLTLSRQENATESLAAYANYYRYLFLFLMPIVATGVAMLPYVGRAWGRRDLDSIRRAFREIAWAASAYSILIVAPLAVFLRHQLVAPLAESTLATRLAEGALLACPLACLAAIPFFACRPVFDGMQRPLPGLTVATLRYVLLTLPGALLGAHLAGRFGVAPLHGVVWGLVAATALSSITFLVWMRRALRRLEGEMAVSPAGHGSV